MMSPYEKLEKQFSRIHSLDHAAAILGWDEAVMMPSGGGEVRAQALAEIKVLKHEILHSDSLNDLIAEADQGSHSLSGWQRANLREMTQIVKRARSVPKDLVEALSLANSRCEQAWRGLRFDNNWEDFQPLLDKVVLLSREEAQCRSAYSELSPYDALLDLFNPGLTSEQVTLIFDEVKGFLPELIQKVVAYQSNLKFIRPHFDFELNCQKELGLEVMKVLGFDFAHGRLDVSHHPFCGGVPQDVRITTRYDSSNFIESLMGIVHETGHACYEQGLPKEWINQPVGMARGMHIHESQSLFFEMYIGRNKHFLNFLYPRIISHLAKDPGAPFWTIENIYNLLTEVKPSLIRVNADEVTYPAHVILRYEIERDLISGNINTKDIPELWNQKMLEYLGIPTQENYKDGCMQDMHWPAGAFGYFPSYSLGAMTAAQLFATIEGTTQQINDQLMRGDLSSIRNWLRGHVWSQGCYSSTNDLLMLATGHPLTPQFFKRHIERKYLGL